MHMKIVMMFLRNKKPAMPTIVSSPKPQRPTLQPEPGLKSARTAAHSCQKEARRFPWDRLPKARPNRGFPPAGSAIPQTAFQTETPPATERPAIGPFGCASSEFHDPHSTA